jgi:serine/threonine protein kinase
LQAIHETCVIHRDIKPANIFMCPDNVVKVGDLGVAKALTKAHYAQTTIGETGDDCWQRQSWQASAMLDDPDSWQMPG